MFGADFIRLSKERDLKDAKSDSIRIMNKYNIKLDMSPREIIIILAQGLLKMNKRFFCDITRQEIEREFDAGTDVVIIDDLRFDHELQWFNELPFNKSLIHLDRADVTLDSIKKQDFLSKEVVVMNNGYVWDMPSYDAANLYSMQNIDVLTGFLNEIDFDVNYI